jgi:UTP--glucose-1-phosphate uridylyltransferase
MPLGLGHAVLCASKLIAEDETFAVMLPDDLIDGENQGVLAQMIEQLPEHAEGLIAIEQVPKQELSRYGVLCPKDACQAPLIRIAELVEKPRPQEAPSNWAIVGRYLLTKRVMHALAHQQPGFGAEIQLTDALSLCASSSDFYGFAYQGKRFDCGSLDGFQKANWHFWAKCRER